MSGLLNLSCVPGLGSLIGTVGSDSLLKSINVEMGNQEFFGGAADLFSAYRQRFVQTYVQPFRNLGETIKEVVGAFDYDEKFIPITSEDMLDKIPMCMHLPILQYQPIRKLFDEGRIFGFGYEYVPEGDPYGRILDNGYVPDVEAVMEDDGSFPLRYHFESTDPELSFDEQDSIRETREWLDRFMEESSRDVTDPLGGERG